MSLPASFPLVLTALAACTAGVSSAIAQDPAPPAAAWQALHGDWIFVEDRTEGRAVEQQQPSMSAKVRLRVEADAVVLLRSNGEVRMPLDGSATELAGRVQGSSTRYHGTWQDGAFVYESLLLRAGSAEPTGRIRTELRPTADGLLATIDVDPPNGLHSVALYRHAEDIAQPTPAPAVIADLQWLAGAWVGSRGTAGTTSIEERWSPPLGGAMLGVSRTVARDRMTAFEYLRLVERDGTLIYVAQPGGAAATEFVLTAHDARHAVFENPRHDFPQRITYELAADGSLSAAIGYAKGGRPRRFEFAREAD